MKYCWPWCSVQRTILKSSFDIYSLAISYASFSLWGTERICFTTKPIELVSHYQIMVSRIHVLLAESCIDEKGYLSSTVRIAWSMISGPLNCEITSLSAVDHIPFKHFVTIRSVIASEPKNVTSCPWICEAENSYLSRKIQIERWSILHNDVIWFISTCSSFTRWVRSFEFHNNSSTPTGILDMLNTLNLFWLCDPFLYHLHIQDARIH
jgi:hypothetical protein